MQWIFLKQHSGNNCKLIHSYMNVYVYGYEREGEREKERERGREGEREEREKEKLYLKEGKYLSIF